MNTISVSLRYKFICCNCSAGCNCPLPNQWCFFISPLSTHFLLRIVFIWAQEETEQDLNKMWLKLPQLLYDRFRVCALAFWGFYMVQYHYLTKYGENPCRRISKQYIAKEQVVKISSLNLIFHIEGLGVSSHLDKSYDCLISSKEKPQRMKWAKNQIILTANIFFPGQTWGWSARHCWLMILFELSNVQRSN